MGGGEEVDPADDREGFEGDEGEEEERGGARGEGEASISRDEARDLAACEESVSKVGVGEEVGVPQLQASKHLRLPRGRSTERGRLRVRRGRRSG